MKRILIVTLAVLILILAWWLINQKTLGTSQPNVTSNIPYPDHVSKLINSYPEQITGYSDNKIIFKNAIQLTYDDHKHKSTSELLINPSIKDQFHYKYIIGTMTEHPQPYQDPGRINNADFFQTMYGKTQQEVEQHLTEIVWAPKLSGAKIKVTTVNDVHKKLAAVGVELDTYPHLKPYIENIGGTYKWRKIAGTDRLSLHSYGIAIDINVSKSNYWQWDCKCSNEMTKLNYTNQIPQLIVDIFEKHGFVWGGKWYHYDTMHFEYRPELLEF